MGGAVMAKWVIVFRRYAQLKTSWSSGEYPFWHHITMAFEILTCGLLQKGWDHSPPKACFEEPSSWLTFSSQPMSYYATHVVPPPLQLALFMYETTKNIYNYNTNMTFQDASYWFGLIWHTFFFWLMENHGVIGRQTQLLLLRLIYLKPFTTYSRWGTLPTHASPKLNAIWV